jgi:hypothetical protein
MPNTNLSDGVIKLNEQIVSLKDNAASPANTNYILVKGSLKAGVDAVESQGQNGEYRGVGLSLQARKGSMTLKFTAANSKPPQPLQFFSLVDDAGATVKCILEEVVESFGVREESTVECAIRVAVGTVSATLPSLTAV